MKKVPILLIIAMLAMVCVSFVGNEKKVEPSPSILGMVLLSDQDTFEVKKVISALQTNWGLEVDDDEVGDEASVIVIDGYKIVIAHIPAPIPGDEIQVAAGINYIWENGEAEATQHSGHVIVSIINAGKNPVAENLLFNKVVVTILNNSNSLGVYMGGRSLLLKKDFYLENSVGMSESNLPLHNWIYFGFRKKGSKHSIFTYGLAKFGKTEMEIVNSKNSIDELQEMVFNITHYVVSSDVTLKDGETIGLSKTQKLKISLSEGEYLEGETLKIKY